MVFQNTSAIIDPIKLTEIIIKTKIIGDKTTLESYHLCCTVNTKHE